MPYQLIALDEAKARLRVEHTDEDADITLMIEAASQAVLSLLKEPEPPLDWWVGSPPTSYDNMPADLRWCVFAIVNEQFHNREASAANLISPAVEAIIVMYRTPTLA
jgi:hypothetical protein